MAPDEIENLLTHLRALLAEQPQLMFDPTTQDDPTRLARITLAAVALATPTLLGSTADWVLSPTPRGPLTELHLTSCPDLAELTIGPHDPALSEPQILWPSARPIAESVLELVCSANTAHTCLLAHAPDLARPALERGDLEQVFFTVAAWLDLRLGGMGDPAGDVAALEWAHPHWFSPGGRLSAFLDLVCAELETAYRALPARVMQWESIQGAPTALLGLMPEQLDDLAPEDHTAVLFGNVLRSSRLWIELPSLRAHEIADRRSLPILELPDTLLGTARSPEHTQMLTLAVELFESGRPFPTALATAEASLAPSRVALAAHT